MFIALGVVLPFITANNQQLGNIFSLMHIPVMLCGFVCSGYYGAAVGFVTPLLRSLIVGMPPMFPKASAMAFELMVYGMLCGILYKIFPKKNIYIYPALIISMLAGRVVSGVVQYVFAGLSGSSFDVITVIESLFVTALPGIICHIIIVPPIVMILKKIKLI